MGPLAISADKYSQLLASCQRCDAVYQDQATAEHALFAVAIGQVAALTVYASLLSRQVSFDVAFQLYLESNQPPTMIFTMRP